MPLEAGLAIELSCQISEFGTSGLGSRFPRDDLRMACYRSERIIEHETQVGRLYFRPGDTYALGMTATGVRRDKAALSSGCKPHPAIRSSRKQPEQAWRRRNV
jgi:hypothetical protein